MLRAQVIFKTYKSLFIYKRVVPLGGGGRVGEIPTFDNLSGFSFHVFCMFYVQIVF